jgi:UDP-N-acetylmuramoylalanine--D-glutamate ligase
MTGAKAKGEGRKAGQVDLPKSVAILGFARSGQALADALLARGVEVRVGDMKPASAFPEETAWRRRGARLFFDGPPAGFLEGAACLALSPGVPTTVATVGQARARGIEVLGEIELAWRIAEAQTPGKNRWIAVTGTNGKSTTTAWIAEMLRRAGRPVALAGNIGVPLSSFLQDPSPRDFVCEISSFQLETIKRFRPHVAVLTNVTPDHLDRYSSFEEYARAKERIFENQTEDDAAVVNADDPISVSFAPRSRRVPFSRAGGERSGTWSQNGWLHSAILGTNRAVLEQRRLALPGAHNLENALAAVAAADLLDTPGEAIERALVTFPGLPHRTQVVARHAGVQWVDDSKGTNVDATRKSLEGYPDGSVLLILGGRDKHGDFAALAPLLARVARRVLTIGEAAPAIESAIGGEVEIERAGDMERAVARAAELARPGDTILLSPACASFDQYRNFEERGQHFARLARAAAVRGAEIGNRKSGID